MFPDDVHQQDCAEAVRQGGQLVRAERGEAVQEQQALPSQGNSDELPREQMRKVRYIETH